MKSQFVLGAGLAAVIAVVGTVGYLLLLHTPPATVLALPTAQVLPEAPRAGPGGITVAGDGEARAEPDVATVSVGATQIAPTAGDAMGEVSRRVAAVIAAAKAQGIQDRDIQTTGLALQPIQRPFNQLDQNPPEIVSYRASNNVTITIRDISRASAVLDGATSAGANVVGGLRFSISDPAGLRAQALANAVRNGTRNAQEMASAAGVHLGGVIAISEEGGSVPIARSAPLSAQSISAQAPPVEPGELVVQARVRVIYGIAP